MKLRVTLRQKLFICILVAIILPVLALTVYSFRQSSSIIEEQAVRWSQNAFNQAEEALYSRVESIRNLFYSALSNPYFTYLLSTDEGPLPIMEEAALIRQIDTIVLGYESNNQIEKMYVYVKNISSQSSSRSVQSLNDFMRTPRYNTLVENRQHIFFSEEYEYINSAGYPVPVVSAFMMINDYETLEELTLVIELVIRSQYFTSVLDSLSQEVEAQSFLLNSSGEIALRSSESTPAGAALVRYFSAAEHQSDWQTISFAQESYYLGKRVAKDTPWAIYFFMREYEIKELSSVLQKDILVAMGGIIVVMIFFTALIATLVTRRLADLRHAMNLVQRGDFNVTLKITGNDETTDLQKDFVYMISKIQTLLKEKEITLDTLRTYELNALHSQINPHFLYNTLDLINWMAFEHDALEIQQTTAALARFYKISLSQGSSLIPLKEELTHVQMYMNIQNKRYDDAITFTIDCPAELEHYIIPKITLQPLVENAIQHGIMQTPEKQGIVSISVRESEGEIAIFVEDNGVGIDTEKLARLVDHANGEGYGLENVNARVKIYFGEDCGIFFPPASGGMSTCVKVIISPKTAYADQ